MPWSPVPKFPMIIEDLKAKGYENKDIPIMELENSIMKTTGLVRERSISNVIRVMERLGYIEKSGLLFSMKPKPKITPEEELNQFLGKI
jgi:hypothetical protein